VSISIPGTTTKFTLDVHPDSWHAFRIVPGDLLEGPKGHGFLVEEAHRAPTSRYPTRWRMRVSRLGVDAIDHERSDDVITYVPNRG